MTSTVYEPRPQHEIVARIKRIGDEPLGEDMFGFRRDALLDGLDFDHAQEFLKPEATREQWEEAVRPIAEVAREYLTFAIGKINDHRGISADRSVQKLREYAWLLGRDDVVAAMNAADYPQYGAPKVKAFAVGMGWDWPADKDLERMAQGLPCVDDCEGGCGL